MENCDSSCETTESSLFIITDSNINSVLASNEVVLMFYSGESKIKTRLLRIMENVAEEIKKAGFAPGKVLIAKVDLNKEKDIEDKYYLSIYGTYFTVFRYGYRCRNYMGKHSVEAIVEFVNKQISFSLIRFNDLNELHNLADDKGHIVAYLESEDQPEYEVLRQVASSLRDECCFYVKFVDSAQDMVSKGRLSVLLRSTVGTSVNFNETYNGSLLSYIDIFSWVKENCFPLLLEYNVENEHLRRNGLFFTLLHMPSDIESLKKYKTYMRKQLEYTKRQSNFFIGDGLRFQALLARFNKSTADLPLIIFHGYGYKVNEFDLNDFGKPEKVKEIIEKVYTGELYYEGKLTYRLLDDTEEDFLIGGLFE